MRAAGVVVAAGVLVVAAVACGPRGGKSGPGGGRPIRAPTTLAEKMIALLPEGAQILVELDLARLRANQTVGSVATKALASLGEEQKLPGLPMMVQGSPLGEADVVEVATGDPSAAARA